MFLMFLTQISRLFIVVNLCTFWQVRVIDCEEKSHTHHTCASVPTRVPHSLIWLVWFLSLCYNPNIRILWLPLKQSQLIQITFKRPHSLTGVHLTQINRLWNDLEQNVCDQLESVCQSSSMSMKYKEVPDFRASSEEALIRKRTMSQIKNMTPISRELHNIGSIMRKRYSSCSSRWSNQTNKLQRPSVASVK